MGDILVGKIALKDDSEQLPEAKITAAIFGTNQRVFKIVHFECQVVNRDEF